MTDNSYLDFYDCNSSSNSLLKFDTLSPTLSPVSSNSTFTQKMDTLSNNNPLLTTASMPIPMRNATGGNGNRTINEFLTSPSSEFGFGSGEKSQSPIDSGVNNDSNVRMHSNVTLNYQGLGVNTYNAVLCNTQSMNFTNPQMWDEMSGLLSASNTMTQDKSGPFQMDEDLSDIFQVDKSDLIQGPTLAELNDTGDTNLYIDLLDMEEDVMLSDMTQAGQMMNPNHHFSQLTSSNFHNLQTAITENSGTSVDLPQQMFQTINITQTPHNTPCNSYQSTMLYYDESNQPPSSPYDVYSSPVTTTARIQTTHTAFSPGSHGSNSSLLVNSLSPPPSMVTQSNFNQLNSTGRSPRSTRASVGLVQHNPKYSTLHELLLKRDHNSLSPEQRKSRNSLSLAHSSPPTQLLNNNPALSPGGYSRRNMSGGSVVSRLSSSAPTHLGLEQIWQRREPRQHLLSTGSLAEGGSTSSLSGALSPEAVDFSTDDINFSSDEDDSEHYEDLTSDNDSDNEDNKDMSMMGLGSDNNNNAHFKGYSSGKKNRFFWQYNVQAKGPKGQRLVIKTQVEDPHFLNEVTDPVFSPNCSVRGIKHSGKARKGDGNDLTPNAKKLNSIGKELEKLSSVINDMTPVSELPINVRPKTRKEKNKLASRACRLKKKAQHEANKIKLYGLEHEHKRLIYGINQMKQLVALKCSSSNETQEDMNQRIEQVVSKATAIRIADNSTEYVNRVLERIKSGIPSGGLDDF